MKYWVTEFKAIRASDGLLIKYCGPHIQAPSFELAQEWCNENRNYLTVIGELIAEIPCKPGTFDPDFINIINYEERHDN
jgi:hypothetical protein